MLDSLMQNFQNIDIQGIVILVFAACISLSFHEMSHAWRAYKLGDDTAQRAGRLTMNPLAHLDPFGTLMIIFARVGWAKPVPMNPVLFTRAKTMKRGIVEVSLAGPLSNMLLAVISYFLLRITELIYILIYGTTQIANPTSPVITIFVSLFSLMYILNINLALFNLLPVPPLDGFKIFGSMLPNNLYYKLMDYERYIGIVFLLIVIFSGGAIGLILQTISIPFKFIIETPLDFIFNSIYKLL